MKSSFGTEEYGSPFLSPPQPETRYKWNVIYFDIDEMRCPVWIHHFSFPFFSCARTTRDIRGGSSVTAFWLIAGPSFTLFRSITQHEQCWFAQWPLLFVIWRIQCYLCELSVAHITNRFIIESQAKMAQTVMRVMVGDECTRSVSLHTRARASIGERE